MSQHSSGDHWTPLCFCPENELSSRELKNHQWDPRNILRTVVKPSIQRRGEEVSGKEKGRREEWEGGEERRAMRERRGRGGERRVREEGKRVSRC